MKAILSPEIAGFLLARYSELERHVEFVRGFIPDEGDQGEYIDPAYVLADLASKRRIVEATAAMVGWEPPPPWNGGIDPNAADSLAWLVLAELALPFADHEDYREEWRP